MTDNKAFANGQALHVGGLNINIYTTGESTSTSPVTVLFFLHGRTGSAKQLEPLTKSLLDAIAKQGEGRGPNSSSTDLVLVTLDHRNHGTRLVSEVSNYAWKGEPHENPRHGIDMYSVQLGTARDISFLVDVLPAYLFPNGERTVANWAICGISLGGHSTWLTLRNDPRVSIGIPIVGSADYLTLLEGRAKQSSLSLSPPYIPDTLRELIKKNDPVWTPYEASDSTNPFVGKKILALSGAIDPLVPWSASETFFNKLNVGRNGAKKVVVEPDVGHTCTPAMLNLAAGFIWEHALSEQETAKL